VGLCLFGRVMITVMEPFLALTALAQLSGPKSLAFLGRLLDSPPSEDLFYAAALAIAEIHTADALKVLVSKYQSSFSQETRQELLLPIRQTPRKTAIAAA